MQNLQPSLFDTGVAPIKVEEKIFIVRVIRDENNIVRVYDNSNAKRLKQFEGDFDSVRHLIADADNWTTEYFTEKNGKKSKISRQDFHLGEVQNYEVSNR